MKRETIENELRRTETINTLNNVHCKMNERNDVVVNVNVNCVIMWMDGLDVRYLFKFMNEYIC